MPKGAGDKLGDIENVKIKIEKFTGSSEELKTLHRICYGRPGKQTTIKKYLRDFCGFAAGEDLEKKQALIGKLDGKMIKTLLVTCDLPTTGTKKDNTEALRRVPHEAVRVGQEVARGQGGREAQALGEQEGESEMSCQHARARLHSALSLTLRALSLTPLSLSHHRRRPTRRRARRARRRAADRISSGHRPRTFSTATTSARRSRMRTLAPARPRSSRSSRRSGRGSRTSGARTMSGRRRS